MGWLPDALNDTFFSRPDEVKALHEHVRQQIVRRHGLDPKSQAPTIFSVDALVGEVRRAADAKLYFGVTSACCLIAELIFDAPTGQAKFTAWRSIAEDPRFKDSVTVLDAFTWLRNSLFHPAVVLDEDEVNNVTRLADWMDKNSYGDLAAKIRARPAELLSEHAASVAVRMLDRVVRPLLPPRTVPKPIVQPKKRRR